MEAIRVHPIIARFDRDQSRRLPDAPMHAITQQSVQPITVGADFVAEAHATPRFNQPCRQLRQSLGMVIRQNSLVC